MLVSMQSIRGIGFCLIRKQWLKLALWRSSFLLDVKAALLLKDAVEEVRRGTWRRNPEITYLKWTCSKHKKWSINTWLSDHLIWAPRLLGQRHRRWLAEHVRHLALDCFADGPVWWPWEGHKEQTRATYSNHCAPFSPWISAVSPSLLNFYQGDGRQSASCVFKLSGGHHRKHRSLKSI